MKVAEMLQVTMADVATIVETVASIRRLGKARDSLGDTVTVELPLRATEDALKDALHYPSGPVREQIDRLIAEKHAILERMGVELVG